MWLTQPATKTTTIQSAYSKEDHGRNFSFTFTARREHHESNRAAVQQTVSTSLTAFRSANGYPVLLHDLSIPFYHGPAICFLPPLDAYVDAFRANGRRR